MILQSGGPYKIRNSAKTLYLSEARRFAGIFSLTSAEPATLLWLIRAMGGSGALLPRIYHITRNLHGKSAWTSKQLAEC